MNGEHSVWFNALKEQTISTKEFAEIEDVIIYELCQKKVSYHNAKTILKFVSDRLEYHQFNTMIDKNPKDTLISELKRDKERLENEVKTLKMLLNEKNSKKLRSFLKKN